MYEGLDSTLPLPIAPLFRMLLKKFLEVATHLGYLAKRQLSQTFFAHPDDASICVNNYRARPFQVVYYSVYLDWRE